MWITLILVLLQWAVALYYQPSLPERIPVHFNLAGEADRYGHRATLLILPALSTGLWLLGYYITRRLPPRALNYPVNITDDNLYRQYHLACELLWAVWIICSLYFLYLIWTMAQLATGGATKMGNASLLLFLFGLFGTLFYYFRLANQRA